MRATVRSSRLGARTTVAVLLVATMLCVYASPVPGAGDQPRIAADPHDAAYWLRHREGWFWYRDPPRRAPRPKPDAAKPPRELIEFEAMQERLENLKRIAIMNPSDANLVAYMRYQRMVMDRSEHFAQRWQRLVWRVPDLDYGLTGRPTNAMAINVFDEQQRDRQKRSVESLAATHGLIFVFRGDCPHCHRFAPILKRFEEAFGFTVLAISLDGRALPEYPNARPDNGMAARLNATAVPALYLTAPATREIIPVGFGVMSMSELVERLAALGENTSTDRP